MLLKNTLATLVGASILLSPTSSLFAQSDYLGSLTCTNPVEATVIIDTSYSIVLNADSIAEGTIANDQHSEYGVSYSTSGPNSELIATNSIKGHKLFGPGLKVTPTEENSSSASYSSDNAIIEFAKPVQTVTIEAFLPNWDSSSYDAAIFAYNENNELINCSKAWGNRENSFFGIESNEGISKVVIDYGNQVPVEIGRIIFEELERELAPFEATPHAKGLIIDNSKGATAELDDFYVPDDGIIYDQDQDRIFVEVCHTQSQRQYPYVRVEMNVRQDSDNFTILSNPTLFIDQECTWTSSDPVSLSNNRGEINISPNDPFELSVMIDSENRITESNKENNILAKEITYSSGSNSVTTVSGSESLYTDINTESDWNTVWYIKPVAMMTWSGIFKGYADNTFRPEESITLAQVAKVSLVAARLNEPQMTSVPVDQHWATKFMTKAESLGLLNGFDNFDYKNPETWNRPATRQETAKALVRAFKFTASQVNNKCYKDIEDEEICAAQDMGIIDQGGDTQEFNPNRPVNRAEMATMIFRKIYEPF